MTNPRMMQRNRHWKRRLTALGVGTFVGLSALIGKQAQQGQAATVDTSPVAVPATGTLTAAVSSPDTTTVASNAVPTTTTAVSASTSSSSTTSSSVAASS